MTTASLENEPISEAAEKMFQAHPKLRLAEDKLDALRVHNVLARFGPRVMELPLLAGALVSRVLECRIPGVGCYQVLPEVAGQVIALEAGIGAVDSAR